MTQLSESAIANLDAAQAVELLRVMELQAAWENLRESLGTGPITTQQLKERQRAYDGYRTRLAAYTAKNRVYPLPELSQNSPKWVSQWLRVLRAVAARTVEESGVETPTHAVAKARRLAERVAARLKATTPADAGPPRSIADAVEQLNALVTWSDTQVGTAALPEATAARAA